MFLSNRRARALVQHGLTQCKVPCGADDEEALAYAIVALAREMILLMVASEREQSLRCFDDPWPVGGHAEARISGG
jgi:hypothetical protein